MLALAGCAAPNRVPDLFPPIDVSEETWRQVETDILAGSLVATGPALNLVRTQMERWRLLVSERTEADFIPWFSSYGTQQWLTAKIAWYTLTSDEAGSLPVDRLAAYLQEQYHERVLDPVAKDIDPVSVIGQATKLYIEGLGEQLKSLPVRYGIPPNLFEERLKSIPMIVLAPPPVHNASLYQIISTEPIESLSAYMALLQKIRKAEEIAGVGLSKTKISPAAKRVSEKVLDRLAISGGTSGVSALVGGVAGMVISLGATVVGVILHEAERQEIEMQVREPLHASLEEMWQVLMEDHSAGVAAGIYYLSGQLEATLPRSFAQPVKQEDGPQQGVPLPDSTQFLIEILTSSPP